MFPEGDTGGHPKDWYVYMFFLLPTFFLLKNIKKQRILGLLGQKSNNTFQEASLAVYYNLPITMFSTSAQQKRTAETGASHPIHHLRPPSSLTSNYVMRKSCLPFKSFLNQTQLIPLLSLIIPTEERVFPISLLTPARAPSEAMERGTK